MPYRHLRAQCRLLAWVGLHIQDKVKGSPQKMGPVGLSYKSVNGLECSLRQFQVVGQHHNGEVWLDLPDLSRDDCAIQESQMVFEHNCINSPRPQKAQTIASVAGSDEFVAVFLQQRQLSWVPVNTEQSVRCHDSQVYIEGSQSSVQNCSACSRAGKLPSRADQSNCDQISQAIVALTVRRNNRYAAALRMTFM